MKNVEKYLLFMVSELGLMGIAGVITYAAMTSELSLPLGALLILLAGVGFGTLIYHGYDADSKY